MENLVADVINQTFLAQPGKFQSRQNVPEALLVEFRTRTNYDTEEGYRYCDLVLYAPGNYVQVWIRRRWNIIPTEDLEYDEDGESAPKKGKDYQKGSTVWECIGDHDSCWRESVRDFLRKNASDITSFEGLGSWSKIVPVASLNLPEKTR